MRHGRQKSQISDLPQPRNRRTTNACKKVPPHKRRSKIHNEALGRIRTNVHPSKKCILREISTFDTQTTQRRNDGSIPLRTQLTSRTLPTSGTRRPTTKGHIYRKYDRSRNRKITFENNPYPRKGARTSSKHRIRH